MQHSTNNFEIGKLFLRGCAGNDAAFRAAFHSCVGSMFGYARLLVGEDGAAEDICQQAFSLAFRKHREYDASRPLLPWLLGFVHREALAEIRRSKRSTLWPVAELHALCDRAAERADLPSLSSERQEELASAISRLPAYLQSAVHLRFDLELSYVEMAAVTGQSRQFFISISIWQFTVANHGQVEAFLKFALNSPTQSNTVGANACRMQNRAPMLDDFRS